MAINYTNLFGDIGEVVLAVEEVEAMMVTVEARRVTMITAFDNSGVTGLVNNINTTFDGIQAQLSSIVSSLISLADVRIRERETVIEELPALVSTNRDSVIFEVISDMISNSETVKEATVVVGTPSLVSTNTPVGSLITHDVLPGNKPPGSWFKTNRNMVGVDTELPLDDTLKVLCTSDSQGSASEGSESFTITGILPEQQSPFNYNQGGNKGKTSFSVANNASFISNFFETFTSDTPNGWIVQSGTPTTDFKENTTEFMVGASSLELATLAGSVQASRLYVSNEKDDSLSVIDMKTLQVVDTIKVGQRPRGITFNKDFSRLYICASDSDTVQILDTNTHKILANLPSGEDPEQFALHPNDRHLYIANEDDAIVTVVDTEERSVIAQIDVGVEPEGMAISPDGRWAINTSETTNMLHWIDTTTHELVDNTLVDQRPRHVEFNEDGSMLWASSEIGGTVAVIDVATRKIIKKLRFKIPGVTADKIQPVGIKLTSDYKTAFVSLGPANHVAVIDTQSLEVRKYLLVGRRVWHLELTDDNRFLYTSNGVSGDVSVIDVEKLKVIKSIKVGRYPWGLAIRP